MTKYKRYAPIGGKKLMVIVENDKIINYSPSKEELTGLEKEQYRDGSINRTINYKKEKLA